MLGKLNEIKYVKHLAYNRLQITVSLFSSAFLREKKTQKQKEDVLVLEAWHMLYWDPTHIWWKILVLNFKEDQQSPVHVVRQPLCPKILK